MIEWNENNRLDLNPILSIIQFAINLLQLNEEIVKLDKNTRTCYGMSVKVKFIVQEQKF